MPPDGLKQPDGWTSVAAREASVGGEGKNRKAESVIEARKSRFLHWMDDEDFRHVNERLEIGTDIHSFCDGPDSNDTEDNLIMIAFSEWCARREREKEGTLDFTKRWIWENGENGREPGPLQKARYCMDV